MSNIRETSPALDLKASLLRPIKAAVGVAVSAGLLSLFMPNYYKSEARLLPVAASGAGNLGGLAAAAAAFGVGIGGGGGDDANFVDILNSHWLRQNLLKSEFRFEARTWRFGAKHQYSETLYSYMDEKNVDVAEKKLGQILGVSKDMKSNVITISVETPSPELSQSVVRKATDLLNQFVVNNSKTRGSEKAAFATARLVDARRDLDVAESNFLAFLERNRNYQMSTDPAVRLRGSGLETELNLRRQLVNTLSINREQALLDMKNDIPIINVLDPGNLPIEKSKPSRSIFVVFVFIATLISVWAYTNWAWVKMNVLDGSEA